MSVPPRPGHRPSHVRRRRVAVVAGVVAGASVLAAALVVTPAAGRAPAATGTHGPGARPNVVFVLTDDLDSSLVQYMPNVQALAARGTSFADYVVADSWCCPSRASIFTGEFPHDTGVRNNGEDENGGFAAFHRLGDESRSFAPLLHDAGYRTAFLGKYLNGYDPTATVPAEGGSPGGSRYVPPGWDEWYALGAAYRNYDYVANHDGRKEVHGHAPSDYLNTVLQQDATTFLQSAAKRRSPFLLEVAPFTPHAPFTPAPQDVGTFPDVTAPRGPAWNTLPTGAPSWLQAIPPIGAGGVRDIDDAARKRVEAVQSVDRMVGALASTLKATGHLQDTVFVFSSDNGYHLGQHRLRPGKLTAFDTDIRVPLIVAGPGVPAGVTTDVLAQNIDLAPTFESLGGVQPPATVDGRSLVDVLHGSTTPDAWRRVAFVEHQGAPGAAGGDGADPDHQDSTQGAPPPYEAIRGADFTYVQYENGEVEYYDLRRDPDELHNIASTVNAKRRTALAAEVAALRTCAGASCFSRASAG